MEVPGRLCGNVLADLGYLKQLGLSCSVRLLFRHLPCKLGVALRKYDGSFQSVDDSGVEVVLFVVVLCVCAEFQSVSVILGFLDYGFEALVYHPAVVDVLGSGRHSGLAAVYEAGLVPDLDPREHGTVVFQHLVGGGSSAPVLGALAEDLSLFHAYGSGLGVVVVVRNVLEAPEGLESDRGIVVNAGRSSEEVLCLGTYDKLSVVDAYGVLLHDGLKELSSSDVQRLAVGLLPGFRNDLRALDSNVLHSLGAILKTLCYSRGNGVHLVAGFAIDGVLIKSNYFFHLRGSFHETNNVPI